ncbi:hypothetical protein ACED56_12360 [Vibrio splendidus]|uniref:hypothetical protein n=1 Tax=Vibrio splendidus TaxID=29497 RepID=UPI000D3ABAF1|nr:hypothetical protein [Vibrio splendidus]MCW4438732.1 hypothetical protein [Vibrio splendidus]PTO51556.1 hypothetical protein CWN82_23125 [Vibrio splendidus]
MVNVLLVSGCLPRYFAGFGTTASGKPFVITTAQHFQSKFLSSSDAHGIVERLQNSWPLAQVSYAVGR